MERNALWESSNPKRSFQAIYSGKCSQSEYKRQRLVTSFELLPKGPLKTRAGPLDSYIFNRKLALKRLRSTAIHRKTELARGSFGMRDGVQVRKKVNFTQVNYY